MIKGLAITPPILGRISIGKVIEKNGKRLPEKDDQFTITSQVQGRDGWITHPLDDELRKLSANGKLRSIPVRVLFNDPEINLRAEYSLFDRQTGRPLCVGNGDTCKRYTANGMQTLPCPAPESCELAKRQACKPYGRLNVQIGDEDDVGSFIFRTTGFNSIRCLTARLHYYQAVSGNLLACLPLELRLRGKSTTQSHRSAIYYADLTIREGMSLEEAITTAKQIHERRQAGGYMQDALDQAVREGFANGAFEDSEEDAGEIVEEFFAGTIQEDTTLHSDQSVASESARPSNTTTTKPSLREKLDGKVAQLAIGK
ncbi:hydrolase or metal-binding protein [Undibacterium sp. CY21W]|uniref:recombination directionality factor n=1 Tax=Undibacterium sp. CY21W TaxID=2762293 RepID=UPI00164AD17C|nr:hydrolase or metal-binding protein [Undibacterium sp. CY21W]MBC3929754.1 hydrolase or metal-binding protein [Undibacterium sp. CY21W]